MVSYYPQLQEGELLYSATARLAAAIFPGRSASYCAERLLGNIHSSFGLLIPNHVDRLLENIPAVTALSREAVLDASTFYLQSPLLDERERSDFLKSVFTTDSTQGRRNFSPRGSPTALKYCVACAMRDAEHGKPAIWRVVPNHHGSFACAEHGIRLQISDAPVGENKLCDPAHWIKLDVAPPPAATAAELAIAKDIAWIHAQRSRITPGYQPIASKLQDALMRRREFTLRGYLDPAKLLEAARHSLSETAQLTFAPQMGQLARGRTLPTTFRTTLQAYCLYAYLARTSLTQILTELANGFPDAIPSKKCRPSRDALVLHYKKQIEDFSVMHPGCTRSQLYGSLPHSADVVRRVDREWYERNMPESRIGKARGSHHFQDWNDRDSKLCAQISSYLSIPGASPFRSYRDALRKLDQPRSLLRRERGRLPKARALLESLISPTQTAA